MRLALSNTIEGAIWNSRHVIDTWSQTDLEFVVGARLSHPCPSWRFGLSK